MKSDDKTEFGTEEALNWIGGEWAAPTTARFLDSINPATGDVIARLADSDLLDVVRAVQAANKAAAVWGRVDALDRARILRAIAKGIREQSEDLAQIESRDQGLPLKLARDRVIARAEHDFARAAEFCEKDASEKGSGKLTHGPLGLCAVITPWSQPLASLAERIAPLLAVGNTVIAKPSHISSLSAARLALIAKQAGLPDGVLNFVFGRGETVGLALASHPGIDALYFTGRTETGIKIAAKSLEPLKRLHFGLGSRNAVIVSQDVDLVETANIVAELGFEFHTATALRGSRIFVQESIYKAFLDAFSEAAQAWRPGDPTRVETKLGPLPSNRELTRFQNAVTQAARENGRMLLPPEEAPGSGFYAQPTAVYDLTLCSTLQQEDITGPLVTISSYKYPHDAIKQANTSPFGQAAYVFTADLERARNLTSKLDVGRVYVNSGWWSKEAPGPATGTKGSGFGAAPTEAIVDIYARVTRVF